MTDACGVGRDLTTLRMGMGGWRTWYNQGCIFEVWGAMWLTGQRVRLRCCHSSKQATSCVEVDEVKMEYADIARSTIGDGSQVKKRVNLHFGESGLNESKTPTTCSLARRVGAREDLQKLGMQMRLVELLHAETKTRKRKCTESIPNWF